MHDNYWHLMLTVLRQTIISRKLLPFAIKIMGEKKERGYVSRHNYFSNQ
jgi:hypothetical protein